MAYRAGVDDDLPMDTSQDVFYFTEGALAYAGYYLHAEDNPLHTHSFVEIAFAVGGGGTHHCVAGRRELRAGDVILLRPGVWHGYEHCERLELYNCCFSSELLRRELSWTREDPLLGYLLWTGPYATAGRGRDGGPAELHGDGATAGQPAVRAGSRNASSDGAPSSSS